MPNKKKILMEPYNPRHGFVLRRWVVKGNVFEAGKTYTVDPATAAYLLSIHSQPKKRGSPKAFRDVTEAPKAQKRTARVAPPKRIAASEDKAAGTLTTSDLPENQETGGLWDEPDDLDDEPELSPEFPDEAEVSTEKPKKRKRGSRKSS